MSRSLRKETLTGQVIRVLSERVLSGEYKLGEKLPTEQRLIEEFSVSRTVVREAVASLRAAGLVSTQQGVGAFVLSTQPAARFEIDQSLLGMVEEVSAILELRIALESEAAALAAARHTAADLASIDGSLERMAAAIAKGEDALQPDLQFHRAVATATRNPHFVNLFSYLGELVLPRAQLQTFKLGGTTRIDYLQRVNREHQSIASAIARSDVEAARAAMRLHLSDSRERLRRHVPLA